MFKKLRKKSELKIQKTCQLFQRYNFRFFIVILTLLSLYLAVIWLQSGMIVGGGDVGIPIYLPSRALEIFSHAWWETQSTGTTNPVTYTAIPFYLLFNIFHLVGLNYFHLQALFLGLILFGSSLSIYYLTKSFFSSQNMAWAASFFYMFNLGSLTVWHRGVHNAMVMLLFGALSLWIIHRGINKRNYYYLLIINLAGFLMSYTYGALAYIAALWLLWLVYLIFAYICQKDWPGQKFVLIFGLLLFVSWVGLNSWWLVHFIESSRYIFGELSGELLRNRSSDVVVALREQTAPPFILRDISKFYLYDIKDWNSFYTHPLIKLLSWLPALVVFSTILWKKNYNSLLWRFCLTILVLVILISKGVNSPLGWVNKWAYDHIGILAPLRNPYEKIGIILIIPYAILFGLGLVQIVQYLNQFKRTVGYWAGALILICCLGLLVWPLWSGQVFKSSQTQALITIPDYYQQADQYISSKNNNRRILQLPISPGESVTYDWGYSGVEPSQLFFKGSSVAFHVGVESIDQKITELVQLIHQHNTTQFTKSTTSLHIGWLVLHQEVNWKARGHESPDKILQWLVDNPDVFQHQTDIGPLSIWRINDKYSGDYFSYLDKLNYLSPSGKKDLSLTLNNLTNLNHGYFFEPADQKIKNQTQSLAETILVSPNRQIKFAGLADINPENALKELPFIRFLPSSPIYPLIKVKELLADFFETGDPILNCLDKSGKRLAESVYLLQQQEVALSKKALLGYQDQLYRCHVLPDASLNQYLQSAIEHQVVLEKLSRQLVVLNQNLNSGAVSSQYQASKKSLEEFMTLTGLVPKFLPQYSVKDVQSTILSYTVPQAGHYQVKFLEPNPWLMASPPRIMQIDNQKMDTLPSEKTTQQLSYQDIELTAGDHEIHLEDKQFANLATDAAQLSLPKQVKTVMEAQKPVYQVTSSHDPVVISYQLPSVDPRQSYELSLDFLVVRGMPPEVSIIQDSDPLNKLKMINPVMVDKIKISEYEYYWRTQLYRYTPSQNASSATIQIKTYPWNDCDKYQKFHDCQDLSVYHRFDRQTDVWLRNLEFRQTFKPDLILEKNNQLPVLGSVQVDWQKVDPTNFALSLKEQKPPYILTFSETFHPAWQLIDSNGQVINKLHFAVNGFANSWYIDQSLPDKISVKFSLQSALNRGIIISVVSLVSLLLVVWWLQRKSKR